MTKHTRRELLTLAVPVTIGASIGLDRYYQCRKAKTQGLFAHVSQEMGI